MWIYTKQLEYPVNITNPDPRMAKLLMALYGGPDSELASGLRYLTQRFTMPDDRCRATLNDIGTEELAHWEMLGTMIYQCMRGASYAQIDEAGMAGYYTMHSRGVFPADNVHSARKIRRFVAVIAEVVQRNAVYAHFQSFSLQGSTR